MYLQYRNLTLIEISGRPDKDNSNILNGKYDNSKNPLTKKDRLNMIFSDWQAGDVLVIADNPLRYPKIQGDTLVEMTREEVCTTGNLSVLYDGEIFKNGKIVKVDKPTNMLKPTWNKVTHKWEESATPEEIKQQFVNDINSLKSSVIYGPYEYKHTDGKTYHQKMRIGKDDSLIDGTISVLTRHPEQTVVWSFDDNNNNVVMTLQDMLKLNDLGFIWIQAVYEAERVLKDGEPKVGLTKEEFKNLAISKLQHSFIK